MTHTKGPWKYRPLPLDDWGIVRADDYVICQARDPRVWTEDDLAKHRRNGTDPWEANARLISAAPDMLEALEAAIECGMVPKSSAREGGASRHARQAHVADMIRDAIAKAR